MCCAVYCLNDSNLTSQLQDTFN